MSATIVVAIVVTIILAAIVVFFSARRLGTVERKTRWLLLAGVSISYVLLLILQPRSWILSNTIVLGVSVLGGSLIGRLLRSEGAVISFCIAAGVVDFLSFSSGPTAWILKACEDGTSYLLAYLCITIPLADGLQPVIGVGDLIILAALYFSLSKLGFPAPGTFIAPLAGMLAALAVGLVSGGIYALPFVALTTSAYILAMWAIRGRGTQAS